MSAALPASCHACSATPPRNSRPTKAKPSTMGDTTSPPPVVAEDRADVSGQSWVRRRLSAFVPKPLPHQTWKEWSGRATGPEGYTFGDLHRRNKMAIRGHLIGSLKTRLLRVVHRSYVERIKPRLTRGDKHMPMAVRRAVHDVADELWSQLSLELPSLIDRVVAAVQEERKDRDEASLASPMLGAAVLAPADVSPPPSPPSDSQTAAVLRVELLLCSAAKDLIESRLVGRFASLCSVGVEAVSLELQSSSVAPTDLAPGSWSVELTVKFPRSEDAATNEVWLRYVDLDALGGELGVTFVPGTRPRVRMLHEDLAPADSAADGLSVFSRRLEQPRAGADSGGSCRPGSSSDSENESVAKAQRIIPIGAATATSRVYTVRCVRLSWASTWHTAYRLPFGTGIHAQLVDPSGEGILEPSCVSVLRGSPPIMLGRRASSLTFWMRSVDHIAFGRRGVLGHLWGPLALRIDFDQPVVTRGVTSDSRLPFTVEFSSDGSEWSAGACFVRETTESGTSCSWPQAVQERLVACRAWLLYHYLPYDCSIWARLRSPSSLLLQFVAACPNRWIRAMFFSILLGCLLVQPEEYTLMRFILALKGTQLVLGVVLALQAREIARVTTT